MYEIRLLTERDAQEFCQFRLRALEESPEAFIESPAQLGSLPIAALARRLRDSSDDNFVLGAFSEGRLLGTAGFYRNLGTKTGHKGRVWGVYVDAAHRRRGVGRSLIESLLMRARRVQGLHQLSLTVAMTQVAARALYDSFGFRSIGVEPCGVRVEDAFIDQEHRVLILDSRRSP